MSVYIDPTKTIIKNLNIEDDGPVMAYATSQGAKYMDEFVPYKSGELRNNKSVQKNLVTYKSIYAHYMFVGKVMGPNIPIKNKAGEIVGWWSKKPKYYTGADIQYHTAGTGHYWHERMKSAYLDTICKEVEDFMKRGITR